jgi:hypothetical protein
MSITALFIPDRLDLSIWAEFTSDTPVAATDASLATSHSFVVSAL